MVAAAALATCSQPPSYLLLKVVAQDPARPIAGVASLHVMVRNADRGNTLVYRTAASTIDATGTDLSVSFSPERTGVVDLVVNAVDSGGTCAVGAGSVIAAIRQGATARARVALTAFGTCVPLSSVPRIGCAPASPTACGDGETCSVDCGGMRTSCTTAGTRPPGALCSTNADCQPGSQCFDFASTPGACPVKVCLKFCATSAECGTSEVGGTPSYCASEVRCGGVSTGAWTCSLPCDPRGAAAAGCPAGLLCLMSAALDHADCGCPEPSRVGQEGTPCVAASECAPGLACTVASGTTQCRRVCIPAPEANDCATGQVCTPLSGNASYGVCV